MLLILHQEKENARIADVAPDKKKKARTQQLGSESEADRKARRRREAPSGGIWGWPWGMARNPGFLPRKDGGWKMLKDVFQPGKWNFETMSDSRW